MKKYLILLSSALMLLVGCTQEPGIGKDGDGGLVDVTFTANLESGVATKAVADGDGAAASVNRCIMEIYYGGEFYARQYAQVNDKKASFAAQVVSNRTYTVAFWADCVDDATTENGLATDMYYTTASLKEIALNESYVGNDDARDAFFVCENYTVQQAGGAFVATLKRPFAQMNVITTDWDKVASVAALKPEKVNVTLKNALVAFNAVTGEASGSQTLEYEAIVYTPAANGAEKTLSMDYLFASDTKALIDIDWKALHGTDANVEHAFAAVPYQRNYRTNIKGALLTAQGQWTVTVDADWTGDGTTVEGGEDPYLVNYFAAGSIAAANEALKTNNAVSIENPSDLGTEIVIPTEQDGKNVFIKVTGASAGDIVINNETDGAANLKVESDSKNLTINTPKSHVDLDKGNYQGVTATTSATTLVVGKDVTIETLTINGGNAEIFGKIASLTRANGVNATLHASDPVTLANYITWAKPGDVVYLDCDVDLEGVNWTPLCANNFFAATFDGQGHTISNLKVTDYTGAYVGFISVVSGGTIKNVTFKDAVLTNAESLGGNARGAVIAGWSYACKIDNCHVINASINGCQKVAGILGSMSVEGSAGLNSVTNCSVDGLTISCNIDNDLFQSGALIGYIQFINANPDGVLVENNSVKNITFNRDCSDFGNVGYYNGTFIGTISRKQKVDGQKILLNNNTIAGTNTEVFKTIYSSPYFGWATNAENYSEGPIVPILIDGVEWTPNYPFKNVTTGKGYATLDAAFTALQQDETLEIWQAGEYAVQTLSTPANSTVDAKVDGVVFNHTPKSGANNNWVSAQTENVKTVKNITWNVGNGGGYPYFSNTNLENCTVNGMLCTHLTNKFKDCTFVNEEGYNFWVYGNVYTEFDNCTFTCPGKNDGAAGCGSALNCYNESAQTPTPVLVVKNCTFTAKEASNKYSAIYVKPETAFDIRITNSTCNDKFCTGAISGSKLWNLKSDREGTTVSIDGNIVYPFCSKDADGNYHIVNADGLLQFRDLYDAGKVASTAEVYLENDIDFTGKTWTACDWFADSKLKGFALFDGQNHTIKNFTISGQGMFSRWACTANIGATPYFKDIVFDGAKNVTSTLNVSLFCGQCYQNAKIENVTIKNSQFEGTYKVAPFVGTVYDENPDRTATLTLKDCKVENTTVRGTSYDFDICSMVAWVNENNNDRIAFEGNNVVKNVTLYAPSAMYNMCANIYHNGGTAYNEAANVTVDNVNVVTGQ